MAVNLWIDSFIHHYKGRALSFIHCNSHFNSHIKVNTVIDFSSF